MSVSVREARESAPDTALEGPAGKRCQGERVASAGPGAREEWSERVRGGLEGLLGEIAAQPQAARALMRSLPAAGPAGYRCYTTLLETFVPFLAPGRSCADAPDELPSEVEMLAIGAVETIVLREIDEGRAAQLPALLPAILFSVLMPFLGPERAAEAMRRAEQAI